MLKKTISFTDYNGEERTEDFFFNLTKAELSEMQLSVNGGMTEWIQQIINTADNAELVKIFKKIILSAYGEKSIDGKRFIKSQELSEGFSQTEAYSELFMELISDPSAAAAFINGLMPADIVNKVEEQANNVQELPVNKEGNEVEKND